MDNDLVTPSLKLKRHVMKKYYEKVIKDLYASGVDEKKKK